MSVPAAHPLDVDAAAVKRPQHHCPVTACIPLIGAHLAQEACPLVRCSHDATRIVGHDADQLFGGHAIEDVSPNARHSLEGLIRRVLSVPLRLAARPFCVGCAIFVTVPVVEIAKGREGG